MLSDDRLGSGGFVGPGETGKHKQNGSGPSLDTLASGMGLMYMKNYGFVDLGHLRDLVDLTKYVYDRLRDGCPGLASRSAPGNTGSCTFNTSTKVRTTHGFATIKAPLSAADLIPVAQSIAYDDSVGYEIMTYWMWEDTGGHNSSFSPEDLPSNFLGTWIAGEAIRKSEANGSAFNTEVDNVLTDLCTKGEAQPKAEAERVFKGYIKGKWVSDKLGITAKKFLQRRNFTGDPWDPLVDDKSKSTFDPKKLGVGSAADLSAQVAKYDFTFTSKSTFKRADYPTKITDIRNDAKQPSQYGALYDSPSDPSFALPAPPPTPPQTGYPAPAGPYERWSPPPPPPPTILRPLSFLENLPAIDEAFSFGSDDDQFADEADAFAEDESDGDETDDALAEADDEAGVDEDELSEPV